MPERAELAASLDRHVVERGSLLARIALASLAAIAGATACVLRCIDRGAGSAIDPPWLATAVLTASATSRVFAEMISLRYVLRTIRALRAALRRLD